MKDFIYASSFYIINCNLIAIKPKKISSTLSCSIRNHERKGKARFKFYDFEKSRMVIDMMKNSLKSVNNK